MQLKNLFTGFLILISVSTFAETDPTNRLKENNPNATDSVQLSIDYLKRYIQASNVWQVENPEILKTVTGLIHFAEDEHIDSILVKLDRFQENENFRYIYRSPLRVSDSLQVAGYQPYFRIREEMKKLDRAIWNGVDLETIPVPETLGETKNKLLPIAAGDEKAILKRTGIVLPDSLVHLNVPPDSLVRTPNDFHRIRNRDQQRTQILEEARLSYNAQIQKTNREAAIKAYREYAVRVYSDSLQNQLQDSLKRKNEQILVWYNDSIVRSVNDSIKHFVQTLQRYADNSDSVYVSLQSLSGNPTKLWLRNNQQSSSRMYLKNEQNDSLGIRLTNIDKHSIHISIDDVVTFNRIAHRQNRDFVFEKFNPNQNLTKVKKRYNIITPWIMGGNGTFGFTQMYLNNWKKGGKSAFSFLMVLKGFANYSSDGKIKWENSAEIRNGWIRQGGDVNQTQKNDDKLELISRLGISAFKKWYYSTEIDFETQFFNGYNYPDKTTTISAYMSPAKILFKLGLDYKPNNNFSLFLSPITAKYVFVRDTALVDQTRYGVSATNKSFWEPGLNADIRYKIDLTPRISYETKYKMFLNYQGPFNKIDISWENMIVAQLTDRINMTFQLFMLYDDNVTFATGNMDAAGNEIFKPKWQTKELTTIGFSYKINRSTYKQKRNY